MRNIKAENQLVEPDRLVQFRGDPAFRQERQQHRRSLQRRAVGLVVVLDLTLRVEVSRKVLINCRARRRHEGAGQRFGNRA